VRYRTSAVIGASIVGVAGLLFGVSVPETYEWFCPGSFDNYCSEPRAFFFDMLLPPTIVAVAYSSTGLIVGAILGALLVLEFRTINGHRMAFSAIGLGAVIGTLLFVITHYNS
jgi:hypothetical protein